MSINYKYTIFNDIDSYVRNVNCETGKREGALMEICRRRH